MPNKTENGTVGCSDTYRAAKKQGTGTINLFPFLYALVRTVRCVGERVANEILMYFRSQRKSSQDVSLSDYIETGTDGAALSLMDVVSDDEDLLDSLSRREAVSRVIEAVNTCLTEQEREVIRLRYGLGGVAPQRQREVAAVTGISRSYVLHHA